MFCVDITNGLMTEVNIRKYLLFYEINKNTPSPNKKPGVVKLMRDVILLSKQ